MAKKKKFTVRVSYKVYDYYDVEATSEKRAIEKALEQSSEDSLNDFIQDGEGEGLVTIINGKPVEPKRRADEMEVLVAYDDGDGIHDNIATMSDKDWKTGCKEQRMKEFLLNHYSEWLDGCTDDDRKEYEDEIEEAATRLSVGLSATCCGDDLYFETVTLI
jgi:hypothetical protein